MSGDGESGKTSAEVPYSVAVDNVLASGRASASTLQRRLAIGYNSAARLIERMEADGIVSAPDHVGRREILAEAAAIRAMLPDDPAPAEIVEAERAELGGLEGLSRLTLSQDMVEARDRDIAVAVDRMLEKIERQRGRFDDRSREGVRQIAERALLLMAQRDAINGDLRFLFSFAKELGFKTNATGVELWDESLAILEGRTPDATTLVVLFAANDNDDWEDEAAWAKANPSLGLSPTIAFLRREANLAKDNPRAEAHFRCYHLNQWIDAAVRWLNIKRWDACAQDKKGWKAKAARYAGRLAFGAIDVSSTRDVTALVWVFPPTADDPHWRMLCRFWVPEDTLAERVKNDRVAYDRWVKDGAMETTPGDFVDQNFVKQAVLEGCEIFDVQRVAYDPWNAQKLVTDLQNDGMDVDLQLPMRQGIQSLGEPTKQFERLVYAGVLDHGGHPVLRWMAGNAVVRFDENLNFMVAKKRSAEKVDGIAAAVMAVGAALFNEDEVGMGDFLANAVMA